MAINIVSPEKYTYIDPNNIPSNQEYIEWTVNDGTQISFEIQYRLKNNNTWNVIETIEDSVNRYPLKNIYNIVGLAFKEIIYRVVVNTLDNINSDNTTGTQSIRYISDEREVIFKTGNILLTEKINGADGSVHELPLFDNINPNEAEFVQIKENVTHNESPLMIPVVDRDSPIAGTININTKDGVMKTVSNTFDFSNESLSNIKEESWEGYQSTGYTSYNYAYTYAIKNYTVNYAYKYYNDKCANYAYRYKYVQGYDRYSTYYDSYVDNIGYNYEENALKSYTYGYKEATGYTYSGVKRSDTKKYYETNQVYMYYNNNQLLYGNKYAEAFDGYYKYTAYSPFKYTYKYLLEYSYTGYRPVSYNIYKYDTKYNFGVSYYYGQVYSYNNGYYYKSGTRYDRYYYDYTASGQGIYSYTSYTVVDSYGYTYLSGYRIDPYTYYTRTDGTGSAYAGRGYSMNYTTHLAYGTYYVSEPTYVSTWDQYYSYNYTTYSSATGYRTSPVTSYHEGSSHTAYYANYYNYSYNVYRYQSYTYYYQDTGNVPYPYVSSYTANYYNYKYMYSSDSIRYYQYRYTKYYS